MHEKLDKEYLKQRYLELEMSKMNAMIIRGEGEKMGVKARIEKWNKKYCEWKWGEMLDYIGNRIKCEMSTDCGNNIIYTNNNRYGKLLKKYPVKCPFCGKKLTIRSYE